MTPLRRSPLWTRAATLAVSMLLTVEIVSSASIPDTKEAAVPSLPALRRLVPRQAQSFYRRNGGLPGGTKFSPRSTVVVEYSHGFEGNIDSAPTAVVSFDASQTHPIVVVNTFDAYLKSIDCMPTLSESDTVSSSVISLQFNSWDIAAEASSVWSTHKNFHLVTSHPGCNLENELGTWRVDAIKTIPAGHSLELLVLPIALHELGTYNVALLGHQMSGTWNPHTETNSLQRRKTFNPEFSKDLSGTQLFSGDTSSLKADTESAIEGANLAIQCIQCNINFNFTVDVNITMSLLNVTAFSITTTVIDFDQTILLGVSTGASGLSLSISRDVFNVPLDGLVIRDLVNIGPEVGVSAELDLTLSAGVNFTMGAKASIAPGATATFDFLNISEVDKGWDTATFQSIPLKVLNGNLNSTITATLSPFIGIGITPPINDNQPLVEARITQNSPSIVISANMTSNVNRDCKPVGENDFESFSTAYQLSAEMTFGTHVGLVGDLSDVLPPWDQVFPHGDFQFYNQSNAIKGKTCVVIVDDSATATKGSPAAILTAAPTGTLLDAASAVPSFDVSKIESYFSVHSQLPTNVDYAQLVQVTTVPDDIKNAVQKTAKAESGANRPRFDLVYYVAPYSMGLLVYYLAF